VVGAAVGEAVSRTEAGVRSHKHGNHEDRRRRERGDRGDSTADRRRVSGWRSGRRMQWVARWQLAEEEGSRRKEPAESGGGTTKD
jgi:hypothetical protein